MKRLQRRHLKALEQELNGVKAERDARNQEKNAAQKAVMILATNLRKIG